MTRINNNSQTLNSMFPNSSEMINSVPEELNIRLENYDYQMWDYRQPILQQRSRAGTMPSYTSIYLADNSFQNRFVENKVHQGGLSASSTLRSTGLEGQDSYGYEKQLSRLSRNRSQSVNQVVTCIKNKSLFPPNRPRASSVDDYSVTWNMSSSIHQNYDQKVMYPLFMKDSEFMADVRNRSEYESGKKANVGKRNTKDAVSKTLWIGNIDRAISVEELTQIFSDYGPIESIRLLLEKECGFITFYHQKDAIQAKEDISRRLGGHIGSYTLKVGYGKADNITNDMPIVLQPTRALWLGNMPPNITDVTLQKIFSPFGIIESIRVLSHKHCGFINYDTADSASAARDSIIGNGIQELIGVRVGFAKVPTSTDKVLGCHDKMDVYAEFEDILKEFETDEDTSFLVKSSQNTSYFETIPIVPEYSSSRKLDIHRLKDMRKRLDKAGSGQAEANEIAFECLNEIIVICSDYIGNTVVQRLFEKCSEGMKTKMLQIIVPHLASIGVHKNGTWAAQKIIELANTKEQMELICQHLQPFIPPLLLDPFGNYVVQGCLRLNCDTQFIINAVINKLSLIVQGRFGARAVRGILESESISSFQQILIAAALIHNAVSLSTHINGTLALSSLIDSPLIENKRWIISSRLAPHITDLATHKFGTHILLKLIHHYETDAQQSLLEALEDEENLLSILSDISHGLPFVLKVILNQKIPEENRIYLQDIAHPLLTYMQGSRYKKASLEFVDVE